MTLVSPTRGVRATARILATADGGVSLHGDGPFDLRRLRPNGRQERICVVGAMSAPHNGDRLRIEAAAGPGAAMQITSAAATIALPAATPGHATYDITLTVRDAAELHWLPQPLISTAGSDLRQTTRVDLACSARLILREEQILGRAQEPPGRLVNRVTIRRGGQTLLDQQTAYGPDALGGNRAIGQLLVIDPAFETRLRPARLLGDHGVVTPLTGPGVLATVIAPDALCLRRHLDDVLERVRRAGEDGAALNVQW
jgi:urease accessory protein